MLRICHVRFTLRALNNVEFDLNAGGEVRGALYDTLRAQACTAPDSRRNPAHAEHCPVCWLLSLERPEAGRGKDVPRPFSILPPLDPCTRYKPGDTFEIGFSLFGRAVELFPYLVLAMPPMGQRGLGYGRGRCELVKVEAVDPLTGERELLMPEGGQEVQPPHTFVSQEAIRAFAAFLPTQRIMVRFLTPMRLIKRDRLVLTPTFDVLIVRFFQRLEALNREYGESAMALPWELVPIAKTVQLIKDHTRWQEVYSKSTRTSDIAPISGFIGEATYEGNLAPFREWLVLAQCIQVGKNTVKGDGRLEIAPAR